MKTLFPWFMVFCQGCRIASSGSPALTEPVLLDPLMKKFILQIKKEQDLGEKALIYFLYPSFCGACTDSVMNLIQSRPLPGYSSCFIYPAHDSLNPKVRRFDWGKVLFLDAHELGRHGLEAAHNQVFLFEDTVCTYHVALSDSRVPAVRRELEKFRKDTTP